MLKERETFIRTLVPFTLLSSHSVMQVIVTLSEPQPRRWLGALPVDRIKQTRQEILDQVQTVIAPT